jgi:SAM-dependent methyltransferase
MSKKRIQPIPSGKKPKIIRSGLKQVLHVGCGYAEESHLHPSFKREQWQEIRMDIDPRVKPDFVGDMLDMRAVKDGTMDAIWSSHNVEHLYAHEVPVALKEFYRVLKEGGFALITLPDIQSVAEHVARGNLEQALYKSPNGPITPLDIMYGFGRAIAKGNKYMAHKTAFTATTLGLKLRQAGFYNVQVKRDKFDLWAVAHKLSATATGRSDKITIIDTARGNSGLADELDRPPLEWKKSTT